MVNSERYNINKKDQFMSANEVASSEPRSVTHQCVQISNKLRLFYVCKIQNTI